MQHPVRSGCAQQSDELRFLVFKLDAIIYAIIYRPRSRVTCLRVVDSGDVVHATDDEVYTIG